LPEWVDVEELKANFEHVFDLRSGKLSMTLPPWSFEILTSDEN